MNGSRFARIAEIWILNSVSRGDENPKKGRKYSRKYHSLPSVERIFLILSSPSSNYPNIRAAEMEKKGKHIIAVTVWQRISSFNHARRSTFVPVATQPVAKYPPTKDSRRGDSPSPPAKPRAKGSKGREYHPWTAFRFFSFDTADSRFRPSWANHHLAPQMRFSNSVNRRIWFIGHHLLFLLILVQSTRSWRVLLPLCFLGKVKPLIDIDILERMKRLGLVDNLSNNVSTISSCFDEVFVEKKILLRFSRERKSNRNSERVKIFTWNIIFYLVLIGWS